MKSVVMNFINKIKKNVNDESGMGVIEIVLIILVLVGLALVFKEQISGVANGVYELMNRLKTFRI